MSLIQFAESRQGRLYTPILLVLAVMLLFGTTYELRWKEGGIFRSTHQIQFFGGEVNLN